MKSKSTIESMCDAQQTISIGIADGMHSLYFYGFQWVRDRFMPAVRSCAKYSSKGKRKSQLLFEAWYYLGHLHSCNGAWHAGFNAYKQSLSFDPGNWSVLRELACMCFLRGANRRGEMYLNAAIERAPKSQYDNLASQRNYRSKRPLLRDIDLSLELVAEQLARWKPREAWSAISRQRSQDCFQAKARVQSALESNRSIHYWEQLCKSGRSFSLSSTDFFFLSASDWESSRFWSAIRAACKSITSIGFFDPRSTQTGQLYFGPPELFDVDDYIPGHIRERVIAVAEYHIARVSCNQRKLKSLVKRFPRWASVRATLEYIQDHGVGPTKFQLRDLQPTLG